MDAPPLAQSRNIQLKNDLASTDSPYLQAHKNNPVAWQQWSAGSIDLAKASDRLIFLSVGYSACHWCHVMERESFSSPEVARILNDSFIPVKVDREIYPQVDDLCMNYVSATTGDGGWPLSVFFTPDLQPVFGGTYWPGDGMSRRAPEEGPVSSFMEVLLKMRDVWTNQRARCLESAMETSRQLRELAPAEPHTTEPEPIDIDVLDDALSYFATSYDPINGGFSPPGSPQFPTPSNLLFLLRIGASIESTSTRFGFPDPLPAILGEKECTNAAKMAVHTLVVMSRSGLRDHLGHGFHRSSLTHDWNVPHFEKMLCDNAQLLRCYCNAWALSRHPEILGTIYSLITFLESMTGGGCFFASEDADSLRLDHTTEGAFYTWTSKELRMVAGTERDADLAARHYGVGNDGNIPTEHDPHDSFMGQNVLHVAATPSVIATEFGLSEAEVVKAIKRVRDRMVAYRALRPRPPVDRKVIAGWNGLAITGLCRASATLKDIDEERSQRCKDMAITAATLIKKTLWNGTELRRYATDQVAEVAGYLDDYAYMTQASIAVYELTFDVEWLKWADELQDLTNRTFASPTGAYHLVTVEAQLHASMNPKPGSDSSMPSPNGIVASNLLLLASYLQDQSYESLGTQVVNSFADEVIQHPFLFASLLGALVLKTFGVRRIAGVGDVDLGHLAGFGTSLIRLEQGTWLLERDRTLAELETPGVYIFENRSWRIC